MPSKMQDWSGYHGADILWGPLGIESGSQAPSISFPQMKSYGFNLIRLPISWRQLLLSPSTFVTNLETVATEADSNGQKVIYDFHAGGSYNTQQAFPTAILSQYATLDEFYTAWWTNKVTFNGQNAWAQQLSTFWDSVISTVDSYASTFGYEIMNEPPLTYPASTDANMQAYNQYIAEGIRAKTSKYVFFMPAYNCIGCGSTTGANAVTAVAPKNVSSIALDCHEYGGASDIAGFSQGAISAGCAGAVLGEYGPGSGNSGSNTNTYSSYFQSLLSTVKQHGFGSCFWAYWCGTGELNLLYSDCTSSTELNTLVSLMKQILGGASPQPTVLNISVSTT